MAGTKAIKTDQEIGHRIAIYRKQAGMTQTELGSAIGITYQQIQKYEKGTNRVSMRFMLAIADALNIDMNNLISYENDEKKHEKKYSKASVRIARLYDRMTADKQELLLNLAESLAKIS